MNILIKNCGLRTRDAIDTAIASGADYLGFILYPPSPRYLAPKEIAALTNNLPNHVKTVTVLVDPTDTELAAMHEHWNPDTLQLHGSESIERIEAIKQQYAKPIIKALGVENADDIAHALTFEPHVDHLLLDAKDEVQKGGTGQSFDWSLLKDANFSKPWFLSGGLDAANVIEATTHTGAPMVDVSSGIESSRGVKDVDKIKQFNEIVKTI